MTEKEILKKIDSNRNEINSFLSSELPLDIIYFNIRNLARSNERLIKDLNNNNFIPNKDTA